MVTSSLKQSQDLKSSVMSVDLKNLIFFNFTVLFMIRKLQMLHLKFQPNKNKINVASFINLCAGEGAHVDDDVGVQVAIGEHDAVGQHQTTLSILKNE
jgi:hypothetical protein